MDDEKIFIIMLAVCFSVVVISNAIVETNNAKYTGKTCRECQTVLDIKERKERVRE